MPSLGKKVCSLLLLLRRLQLIFNQVSIGDDDSGKMGRDIGLVIMDMEFEPMNTHRSGMIYDKSSIPQKVEILELLEKTQRLDKSFARADDVEERFRSTCSKHISSTIRRTLVGKMLTCFVTRPHKA